MIFSYEFICFMNSYMNSGVPRFQMAEWAELDHSRLPGRSSPMQKARSQATEDQSLSQERVNMINLIKPMQREMPVLRVNSMWHKIRVKGTSAAAMTTYKWNPQYQQQGKGPQYFCAM